MSDLNAVAYKPSGLRNRRKAHKREEILKAGLKVFSEKGFRGATMDDIALELDATKGLLYYHFKNKGEILSAVLAESELISGIEAGMVAPEGLPLAQALGLAVRKSLELMESNRELVRFLHVQALLSGREAELVYTAVLHRLYEGAALWIEAFKRTGDVRPEVDSRTWGRLLIDFITSHFLQRQIFGGAGQPPREYLDGALDVMLNGIATEKAKGPNSTAGARAGAM